MTVAELPGWITQADTGQTISPFNGQKVEDEAVRLAPQFLGDQKPVFVNLEPDNCGRYLLVFTPLTDEARNECGNDWLLSVVNFETCYTLSLHGYIASAYAAEKWTNGNIADGAVLSVFLKKLGAEVRRLQEQRRG